MSQARRFAAVLLGISVLAGISLWFSASADAQVKRIRVVGGGMVIDDGTGNDPFTSALTLPTDRKAQQVMNASEQLIKEKEWGQVVKALQSLLDMPQDGFVQITRKVGNTDKTATKYVSMKEEANRLIGTMPPEGLQFYEVQYGGAAKARLGQAREKLDAAILAEVDTRYRHTDAGIEAAILLGTRFLRQDEPLMASLYFTRLFRQDAERLTPWTMYKIALSCYRAGNKEARDIGDEAWKLLLKKIDRQGGLELDNKTFVTISALRTELDRAIKEESYVVADHRYFRGDPSRSGQAQGGTPFMEATWNVSTLPGNRTEVKQWTEDNIKNALDYVQGTLQQPVLPSFFPIAVAGKAVYRTYDGVYAVSLKQEGKMAWYSYTDGGVNSLLTDVGKKGYLDQWNGHYRQNGPRGILYENSVLGSLSTDGVRVFVVDDLCVPPHPFVLRQFNAFGPQPNFGNLTDMVNRNSLKAYNLETGKLVWELSGRYDKESELAGSFFLGPPLPLGGKSYVLTEKNSELRFACLEPKDTQEVPRAPEIVWTQTLALSKEKIQHDINRRIHCAHLAYGNGILVCPTNAGAVLGVNLLSHSLVWAYFYREGSPAAAQPNPRMMFNNQQNLSLNTEWRVSAPAVVENRVVFTAPDANGLYCLDLADGSLQWRVQRDADDLFFAGVFGGKALVVGKNYVKAYHLHTKSDKGALAWRLDNIGTPSGQGAASENVYYLPLKAGADKEPAVLPIDVVQGRALPPTKSRKKEIPGNLVFYNGEVLSQTLTGISSFPQLQTKLTLMDERLKANPNDPEGLFERGTLRLDKGLLTEAYQDLHAALDNKPAPELRPRAEDKLRETLTEMFRDNFDASEKHYNEFKDLCSKGKDADEQRRRQANFLCLVAKGREKQGKLVAAFDAYMDFGKLTGNQDLIDVFGEPGTKSPPAVWARGRISAMLEKATAQQRKPLEDQLAAKWDTVKDGSDVKALRHFADLFDPSVAVGRKARLSLAERLLETGKDPKADDLREAQLLLLQIAGQQTADPQAAAQAVEALARLMLQKGQMSDAAFYYRKLGRDFAKTVVKDGKTGADLYSEITTDKRFLPFLEEARPAWNGGFKVSEIQGQNPVQASVTLEPAGDPSPFFRSHRLALDMSARRLRVIDQLTGEKNWESADLPVLQYLQHLQFGQARNVYVVRGNVAILNLGHMVYAFDPVDQKKLWEYNLYDPGTNKMPQQGQVMPDGNGNLMLAFQDGWKQRLGQVVAAEASYVCLQTRHGLVALDPLKGSDGLLWRKSDISAQRTQIFGDEQYVYLVELNNDGGVTSANKAIRAADGVTVTVPEFGEAFQHKLAIVGRTLLVREDTGKGPALRLYDVLTGKDVWKKEFPAESHIIKSDTPELAGVVDPDGNVTIFDLRSRTEVLKATVKKEHVDKVQEVYLTEDRDQFYLALNKTVDQNLINNGGVMISVFHGMRTLPVNGTMYALNRTTGKPNWYYAIANQLLVLDQFRDLPILLFTSRVNDWVNNGGNRFNQPVVKVMSRQKANGKLLYDKSLNHNMGNFHAVMTDPKAGIIDLVSFNIKIRHVLEPKDTKSASAAPVPVPVPAAAPQPAPPPGPKPGEK